MKRQFLFGTMLTTVLAIGASAQTPQTPPAGQGSTATPSDTRSQPAQNQSGQTLTLTGCVQPASQTPGGAGTGAGAAGAGAGASTGAGSTASASGRGGNYILTNVSPGSTAGSTSATGAAGTAGTGAATGAASTGSAAGAASGAPATSYRLMGGDSQNLSQYVGQRVEVTGTVSGAGATGAGGAGTGATGGAATGGAATGGAATGGAATGAGAGSTGAGSRSGGDMPMLRVTAVKPASGGGSCSQ